MNIQHDFKPCDDEKVATFSKSAVVVVGTTGTGKSSLIKLFCGNDVKVGHGVASETQNSHLFTDRSDKERFWLDSQGANDSKGVEDEKVLTDALRSLYEKYIGQIKVIWSIEGGRFDRAKDEFNTQAKFINSLGGGVWRSTLIIQKGGRPSPKHINGVLAAAKQNGCDINYGDARLFGFTGLEYNGGKHLEDDEHYQDWLSDYRDDASKLQEKLIKFGYYTNKQIMQHVNGRLAGLSTFRLSFTLSKCAKCGVKGDERFIFAPCHVASEWYHPGSWGYEHPNGVLDPSYYHSSSAIEFLTFSLHACCGKEQGSRGCKKEYQYRCCGRSEGSSGCRGRYSCCDSTSSSGCRQRCSNAGCRKRWGTGPGCIQTSKKK